MEPAPLVCFQKNGDEYEFACYPATLSVASIIKSLSDIGTVAKIQTMLTEEDDIMGIVKVKLRKTPKLKKKRDT